MHSVKDDAEQLAAGIFFSGNNRETTFHMQMSRPTARCQAGLDRLVEGGYLQRTEDKYGAVTYRPTDLMRETQWPKSYDNGLYITEPIPKGKARG